MTASRPIKVPAYCMDNMDMVCCSSDAGFWPDP